MDILSDAVAVMRVGVPHANRTVQHAPWRTHFPATGNAAGFHVVLHGSCWLVPDGGDAVQLQVGDVAFMPRARGHAITDSPERHGASTGDGTQTVLLCGAYYLDESLTHPALAELPDVVHLPARIGHHDPLRAAIDLLGHEVDADHDSGAVAPLLEILLLFMLRAWHDTHPADTGWVAALRDPALHTALHAIHTEPATAWTVQSLAARAGLSRSVFAQRFTTTLGTGPLSYLTWWRMTRAARLLRENDALLRVIAEKSGYSSEYAFAKAFKREFGVSPGRFRTGSAATAA